MNLAKNIVVLRKINLMSQGQFAEMMNVSRQTISKWENGASEPAINDIVKMAEIFEVKLDELILGDVKPNNFEIKN